MCNSPKHERGGGSRVVCSLFGRINLSMNWFIFALLSALFAAMTAILAKIGIKGIDSNLATAVRVVVIMFLAYALVWYQGNLGKILTLSRTNVLFLVLSGVTTGLSWLFYFKALQIGDVGKVSVVDRFSLVLAVLFGIFLLGEKITIGKGIGVFLVSLGMVLTVLY